MIIAFILSMPGRNSWNGKWSGESRCYAIVKSFSKRFMSREQFKINTSYSYDFRDGWRARVDVREVDSKEARKLRAKSVGFCGYDWMVTSIVCDGDIYGPTQPKPESRLSKLEKEEKE